MPRKKITEENTVSTETTPFDETTELPDFDVDVDAPQGDAEDTIATQPEAVEGEKPAKEKKESTRPPVPEGKVSPVAFAKLLSKHLTEKAQAADPNAEAIEVKPQVVYSYIKNNGEGSKNPFPATKSEGRAAVVDADAAIAWWDAKDARVAASKQAQADKAAKKAEKATQTGETVAAPATDAPELVEAE